MAKLTLYRIAAELVPTPEPGFATVFIDETDGEAKMRRDDGTVTALGGFGGSITTDQVLFQTGVDGNGDPTYITLTQQLQDLILNGGGLTAYDEGVLLGDGKVSEINFVGGSIKAMRSGNRLLVYSPAPNLASDLGTQNGATDARVVAPASTLRHLGRGTGAGTWEPPSLATGGNLATSVTRATVNTGGPHQFKTNDFFAIRQQTLRMVLTLLDGSGAVVATLATAPLDGNKSVTAGGLTLQVTSYAADAFQWKAKVTSTVDFAALSLPSGRYTTRLQLLDPVDAVDSSGTGDLFYDKNQTPAALGSTTFALNNGYVTRSISGVRFLTVGTSFKVDLVNLTNLNLASFPADFIEYRVTALTLGPELNQGTSITSWTNLHNQAAVTFTKAAWALPSSVRLRGTALAQGKAIDWTDGPLVASPGLLLLVDSFPDAATRVLEIFGGESRRLRANLSTAWDSTQSLASYDGGNGLQVLQGALRYPPAVDYGDYLPDSTLQPDYSALTSQNRVWYRSYESNGSTKSNGIFFITGLSETDLSNGSVKIELSPDGGTRWYSLSAFYPGGALANGNGCRIDNAQYNLSNNRLRFTLGTGGFTTQIHVRVTMTPTATAQITQLTLQDW